MVIANAFPNLEQLELATSYDSPKQHSRSNFTDHGVEYLASNSNF